MSRLGGLRKSLRGVESSCQCLLSEMRCSRHRDRNPTIIYTYSASRSHSRDHNTGRYNSLSSQQGSLKKSSHGSDIPDNSSRHVQNIVVLPLSHPFPYSMGGFSLNRSLYQPRIPLLERIHSTYHLGIPVRYLELWVLEATGDTQEAGLID